MSEPISKVKSSGGTVDAAFVDEASYNAISAVATSQAAAFGFASEEHGYLNGQDLVENDTGGHSGFVYVRGFDRVVAVTAINEYGMAIAAYDDNKNYMHDQSILGAPLAEFAQNNLRMYEMDLSEETYKDVAYVRVSTYSHVDRAFVAAVNDGACETMRSMTVGRVEDLVKYNLKVRLDKTNIPPNAPPIDPESGLIKTHESFPDNYCCYMLDITLFDALDYRLFSSDSSAVLVFYDESMNPIPSLIVPGINNVATERRGTIDLTQPEYADAKYVTVFTYHLSGSTDQGMFADAFVELYTKTYVDPLSSPLKGKVIDVIGDSITSIDYVRPNWWEQIATDTMCSFNDYGWSGTTLAHTDDRHLWGPHFTKFDAGELGYDSKDPSTWAGGGCMVERLDRIDYDADAVVVMGGTNDGNNVTLGEWDSEDTSTWYGALNTIMKGLVQGMAGKPVMFMTTIQSRDAYESNVSDPESALDEKRPGDTISLQLKNTAMKRKAAQYGIHVLDLWSSSGISGLYEGYYRNDDTLHPSAIGQAVMKHAIQSALEDLFR